MLASETRLDLSRGRGEGSGSGVPSFLLEEVFSDPSCPHTHRVGGTDRQAEAGHQRMAGEFSPGAGASAGFSAWAESTLWVPERRGLGSRGTVEDLFPLPGPQSLSRSSCSLPPTLASDTDNLTLIHMLSGTHPDTHLHRHTHLRTQYTSRLRTAYTPRPERLPPHCLPQRPPRGALLSCT